MISDEDSTRRKIEEWFPDQRFVASDVEYKVSFGGESIPRDRILLEITIKADGQVSRFFLSGDDYESLVEHLTIMRDKWRETRTSADTDT